MPPAAGGWGWGVVCLPVTCSFCRRCRRVRRFWHRRKAPAAATSPITDNLLHNPPPPQPGAEIAEICQLASMCGVPVVFALTRVGLGSIFGANKRMSGEGGAEQGQGSTGGGRTTVGLGCLLACAARNPLPPPRDPSVEVTHPPARCSPPSTPPPPFPFPCSRLHHQHCWAGGPHAAGAGHGGGGAHSVRRHGGRPPGRPARSWPEAGLKPAQSWLEAGPKPAASGTS